MAKVFKSFQVRIDPATRLRVPGLATAAPAAPPPPDPEDEEDQEARELLSEFQALSPDKLAGPANSELPGTGPISSPSAVGRTPGSVVSAAGTPLPAVADEGKPTEPPPKKKGESAVAAILKARIEAALEANKRREMELNALEEQLRDWEQNLQQREHHLEDESTKHHQNIREKVKSTEGEISRMVEAARANAESLMASARAEAEALKKAAQIEAETLKRSITSEIESSRQRAEKEGYSLGEERGIAAGEKAGLQEIRLEWQNLMQEAETLVTELQTSRLGILKASEEEMVRLVIAMARKVIKAECQSNPEVILLNIDAALNKISAVDKIVLRINLKDKAMAESHKAEFVNRLAGISELALVEDNSLTPGGVRIETGVGSIDASIETQAEELERALLRTLKRTE